MDDYTDAFDGARVLVTGGAGFLGSWVCERLLGAGAHVQCVDSLVTGQADNVVHLQLDDRFRLVEADVAKRIPAEPPLDHVLHLASPASPVHYRRLPLETLAAGSDGTRNALDLAAREGARFLFASSSEVYGDPEEHPQPETYRGRVDPVGPRSCYDEAKRFGEALTVAHHEQHGTDTSIARIFNTYGPRMAASDGRVVSTLLHQALAGEPMTVAGDGTQTRSLCWVGDTVDGLLRLLLSGQPGPVNIGSEDEWRIVDLAGLIKEITGSSSPIVHVDLPKDDPALRRPDITRARELLGWEPRTPLEEGLRETMRWLASQPAPQSPEREHRDPSPAARAG